ncbi:MAG: FAD-binding protein [Oligoflexus sp.]
MFFVPEKIEAFGLKLLVLGILSMYGLPLCMAQELPWEQASTKSDYSLLYCPLVKLSLSCGNQRCEKLLGEKASNCPQDCSSYLLQNWNEAVQCEKAQELFHPETEIAVQTIVREAQKLRQKLRVVGGAFSNTSIICSDDIMIATDRLNKVIGLELYDGEETVLVQAGARLDQLMEWLAERDLALEGYPAPILRPATIGGVLATSSHSSSTRHKASMSDIVASVDIVNWQGEIKTYAPQISSSLEWRAATANLGLLGVMTKIRLKVRPEVTLHMRAEVRAEEELFAAGDPIDIIDDCDYGQMWWNPVAKKFLWICGQESDQQPDLSADNNLTETTYQVLRTLSSGIAKPLASVFELAACSRFFRCKMRDLITPHSLVDAKIFSYEKNGKKVRTDEVYGRSFRMITSDFDGFHEIRTRFLELVVPASQRKSALEAIRDYYRSSKFCELFSVYNLRFVPVTEQSLISNTAPGEGFIPGDVAMFIEINGYYPKGMEQKHFAEFDAYNAGLVKILMDDFGARPHWGKGEGWFHSYAEQLGRWHQGKKQFKEVLRQADPHGMFQNDFTIRAGLGL